MTWHDREGDEVLPRFQEHRNHLENQKYIQVLSPTELTENSNSNLKLPNKSN
jgi:hypothetical protein